MRVKLDDGAFMPKRAHELDAGFDIRTPIDFVVGGFTPMNGDGKAVVDTGVHVEIPAGHVGMLKSKSGLNVTFDLTGEGVIDAGFVGSIVAKLYNHGTEEKHFQRGDKIIQLVLLPVFTPELELVDELDETERGVNGFGSTGR